jgi:hypothetical protein
MFVQMNRLTQSSSLVNVDRGQSQNDEVRPLA